MTSFSCALRYHLLDGVVIPAHPLALTAERKLDETYQAALSRYYVDAGAGGVAMAVHTTQFAVHDTKLGLLGPVLELASQVIDEALAAAPRPFLKIAGIIGSTEQALREAELALTYGYHAGLLSIAAFKGASDATILQHCRLIAERIPIFGFYLQPAVGGRELSYDFWRQFVEIPNVVAIKIAPFNRYRTLDVVRAVADSGRAAAVALYTGNDDNIVPDLLTDFCFDQTAQPLRIVGGLLGHWAVWTHKVVQMLEGIKSDRKAGILDAAKWLTYGVQITDANSAFFDVANNFQGSIAGLHEVLRRQGLMQGVWCLDPNERLSPGQLEEINRVYQAYPHLNDDEFVAQNIERWLH